MEYFYIFLLLFVILAGWRLFHMFAQHLEIKNEVKKEKERKKHGTSARRYRMARLPD